MNPQLATESGHLAHRSAPLRLKLDLQVWQRDEWFRKPASTLHVPMLNPVLLKGLLAKSSLASFAAKYLFSNAILGRPRQAGWYKHSANMSWMLLRCATGTGHHPKRGGKVPIVVSPWQAPPEGHATHVQSFWLIEVLLRYSVLLQSAAVFQPRDTHKDWPLFGCAQPSGHSVHLIAAALSWCWKVFVSHSVQVLDCVWLLKRPLEHIRHLVEPENDVMPGSQAAQPAFGGSNPCHPAGHVLNWLHSVPWQTL